LIKVFDEEAFQDFQIMLQTAKSDLQTLLMILFCPETTAVHVLFVIIQTKPLLMAQNGKLMGII
jgi:hypothetical protein